MAGYIGSKAAVVSSGAERKKVITATAGQTAFTGLTYSPNRVHVFQNGVRLVDGTDYTATDGTSLTLTVGASVNDQVVVVSYNTFQTSDTVSASAGGTFAGDVNFTGAFTSQGIDDNATSTAMTLDSSGNLLVGKTSDNNALEGISLASTGAVKATNSSDLTGIFNRLSTDGDIVQFKKDGTTVGNIGTQAGTIQIDGTSGSTGLLFGASNIYPRDNGANSDGGVDIGGSSIRFKDLYLSGGVYLGGTGAANKLDDYEEGGWTASSSQCTISSISARYTKIGRMVLLQGYLGISGATSDNLIITGLPFAPVSHGWSPAIVNCAAPNSNDTFMIRVNPNNSIDVKKANDAKVVASAVGSFMTFSLAYPIS